MSADTVGLYSLNPSSNKWVAWITTESDDDQRPSESDLHFDSSAECEEYFANKEDAGYYFEYDWHKEDWNGYRGESEFHVGQRVYWRDPDFESPNCSGCGFVVNCDRENNIVVKKDDGSIVNAPPYELSSLRVSNGIHGYPTFGYGDLDCNGYWEIGDPVEAREAERRDGAKYGSYWPFPVEEKKIEEPQNLSDALISISKKFADFRPYIDGGSALREYDHCVSSILEQANKAIALQNHIRAAVKVALQGE